MQLGSIWGHRGYASLGEERQAALRGRLETRLVVAVLASGGLFTLRALAVLLGQRWAMAAVWLEGVILICSM